MLEFRHRHLITSFSNPYFNYHLLCLLFIDLFSRNFSALNKRVAALQSRRKKAEELLALSKNIELEEVEVVRLEREALNVSIVFPYCDNFLGNSSCSFSYTVLIHINCEMVIVCIKLSASML